MIKKIESTITEADLSRYTHQKISSLGIFGWRVPLGGILKSRAGKIFHAPNPLSGFPDFAGVTKDGRFWALELKAPKGRVSIVQKGWHQKLKEHHCIIGIAKSVEEINAFLEMVIKK